MPGYVENAAQFMKHFDIFAMSSITEGLPMVLLEAMQKGIPVVSTKAGGVVNVVRHGHTGLLVDHSDPHALATAIERIYRDEKLRLKFGQEAKQEVLERYSSRRMALEYLEMYREVLQYQDNEKTIQYI